MRGHQEYLEAPYVAAAAQQDAYERWCDSEGLDADGDHWADFEQAMEDAAEDAAIAAAEAREDR
jgi:hypothetical protein